MKFFRLANLMPFLSVAALVAYAGCAPEETAEYPEQQYPQQYPQQTYPQQTYPQQQPGYAPAATTPAPAQTAPQPAATGSGQPSAIPGLEKMPDGTCQFTPPIPLQQGQPPQPMTVPCPPGI